MRTRGGPHAHGADDWAGDFGHSHVFLGAGHARNERRTWGVIALCTLMMAAEIVGGLMFGSIALVADGLHMSTHAGALLLAALAYSYARRHADDARFTFGTGKLGDLAGFTSAVVLVMIAMLIGYEAVMRLIAPIPVRFDEAIAIAVLGLGVNLASAFMLGGGAHDHGHGHDHDDHDDHDHRHHDHDHDHPHHHHDAHTHRDHNLRAAARARDGRCGGLRAGHRRAAARPLPRLGVDGSAGRPHRRGR